MYREEKIPEKKQRFSRRELHLCIYTPSYQMNKNEQKISLPFGKHRGHPVTSAVENDQMSKKPRDWLRHLLFHKQRRREETQTLSPKENVSSGGTFWLLRIGSVDTLEISPKSWLLSSLETTWHKLARSAVFSRSFQQKL